jgi:Integrase core domain
VESFNGKLRDELLDREIFYSLREAEVLIERWRGATTAAHHNTHLAMSLKMAGYVVENGRAF